MKKRTTRIVILLFGLIILLWLLNADWDTIANDFQRGFDDGNSAGEMAP